VTADVRDRLCGSLREGRLTAVEDRADAALRLGRHVELVAELTGLVHDQPLRERLVGQLMTALHRAGRTSTALAVYRTTSERLAEEFGLDPGAELRRLELSILRDDPASDRPAASHRPEVRPRQLPAGHHRVRRTRRRVSFRRP
jgi:DNA-binding SARP family transcriptional activator